MGQDFARFGAHPSGEQSPVEPDASGVGVVVDSLAGPVRVEFDHGAAFTPLGQLPFFIDFLKAAGAVRGVGGGLPAALHEPERAQEARRAGDGDGVDVGWAQALRAYRGATERPRVAELLGMSRIVSEDAVRRAFAAIEDEAGANWLRGHLDHCVEPLLSEPWILDVDTTVKPLYGRQEGAVVGYNPKKPGRAQPLLSHLFDGGDAIGSRGGCELGRRAHFQSQRAWPVGVVGSNAARLLAFSFARRQGLRQ